MSTTTREPYYGRAHSPHTAMAVAAAAGDWTLLPHNTIDGHTVALGLCLTGPTPHLTITSDHDHLTIELTPAQLERFLDEVGKINAVPQVELRTVEVSA